MANGWGISEIFFNQSNGVCRMHGLPRCTCGIVMLLSVDEMNRNGGVRDWGHTGGWVDPVASNADSKGHFQHDNNKYSLVIPFSITDRERSIPIIHSLELHATRLHSASVHLNRTMTRPYFRFIIN